MKKSSNIFRSLILFLLLNCVIIDAYSISISARRLYLDPTSSTTNIRVLNLDAKVQNCEVAIKNVAINKKGQVTLTSNDVISENSAKPLVRLAPRRFTLGIKDHQMVKLLYRRKPGIKNGEYQGVLAIKCKEKAEKTARLVTVEAALVHNVPVIVRTAKMPIKAEFVSTKIKNNNLHIELKIQGQRSITGDLTLINQDSGEIVAEKKRLSIYAQQPVKILTLPLGGYQDGSLLLKFTEDPRFGGELTIEQPIK